MVDSVSDNVMSTLSWGLPTTNDKHKIGMSAEVPAAPF